MVGETGFGPFCFLLPNAAAQRKARSSAGSFL